MKETHKRYIHTPLSSHAFLQPYTGKHPATTLSAAAATTCQEQLILPNTQVLLLFNIVNIMRDICYLEVWTTLNRVIRNVSAYL